MMGTVDVPDVKELLGPPPRAADLVESWTRVVDARIRRLTRWLGVALIGAGGLLGVLIASTSDANANGDRVAITAATLVFVGLLPAWAIRVLWRRDVGQARRLVARGTAYPASITRRGYVRGNLHHVELKWIEHGRDARARFDVPGSNAELGDTVAVLAIAGCRNVGAVIRPQIISIGRRQV